MTELLITLFITTWVWWTSLLSCKIAIFYRYIDFLAMYSGGINVPGHILSYFLLGKGPNYAKMEPIRLNNSAVTYEYNAYQWALALCLRNHTSINLLIGSQKLPPFRTRVLSYGCMYNTISCGVRLFLIPFICIWHGHWWSWDEEIIILVAAEALVLRIARHILHSESSMDVVMDVV